MPRIYGFRISPKSYSAARQSSLRTHLSIKTSDLLRHLYPDEEIEEEMVEDDEGTEEVLEEEEVEDLMDMVFEE